MLREILARFGVQVDSRRLQGFGQAITAARNAIGALAVVVIGRRLIQGIARFISEMAELGDETAKTARTLGVTGAELQEFRFAAERSGVTSGQLTTGLRRLQRNIVDAGEGSLTAVRAFRDLGVEFSDSEGRAREIFDILPELADAFGGLETDTQRSARAQQLFGRAGAQLLPFFAEGAEGIEALRQRFRELGGGMSEEFLQAAEAAQDALADFEVASVGVRTQIAAELLPTITAVISTVSEMVGRFRQLTDGTNVLRGIFLAFGVVAAAAFVALLPAIFVLASAMVPIALLVGAIVLAIDSLLTFMEGGDSVIGRFLDAAFGEGTGAEVANTIREAWESFVDFFQEDVLPLIEDFIGFLAEEVPPAMTAVAQFIGDVARAVGDFFTDVGQFISDLIDDAGRLIDEFVQRIQAAFGTTSPFADLLSSVGGFFGIETGDPTPGAEATAGRVSAAVVRRQGGTQITQQTTNQITIENAGEGPTPEFERRVRRAISDANDTQLRKTSRALTQVVGT